jgi:transposase
VHPQEAFLQTLRTAQQDPAGRARLRTRTTIEHSLARVQQVQGSRARYKGPRKNTVDLRRIAALTNIQRVARLPRRCDFSCSAL